MQRGVLVASCALVLSRLPPPNRRRYELTPLPGAADPWPPARGRTLQRRGRRWRGQTMPSLADGTARTPPAAGAPAGSSRDEIEDTSTGQLVAPIVARTSEESGRPGSNWHHQLGRSEMRIFVNLRERKLQVRELDVLA